MKKLLASLLAAFALSGSALTATAQPAPKLLVVDMSKLLDSHYETEDQNAKLKVDEAKANEEIERIVNDGKAIEEAMKEMQEKSNNPAMSAEAKGKLELEFRAKAEERQRKLNELNSYRARTQNVFKERIQNFRGIMFEKISGVVQEIAKKKGATLVLDKSGFTHIGLNPIVYADPAYDITEEVKAELNKNRPAGSAAAKPAAAATPAAPAAAEAPLFKLPK